MTLPGGIRFELEAIDSTDEPTAATAVVRLDRPVAGVKAGDRDASVSANVAEITAVSGDRVTLKLALHESREGWRYRGQLVIPGATFTLQTDAYLITGTIEDLQTSRR